MLDPTSPQPFHDDVVALHERCGVYTQQKVVSELLDAISWSARENLSVSRLLEPAAGDGAFVVEAASRLISSFKRRGCLPKVNEVENSIVAYEILESEAAKARERIRTCLVEHGLRKEDAGHLARRWLRTGDFLIEGYEERAFSHVAGNPPYARWSTIPERLRYLYERVLPRRTARGDLFLPFLDRSLSSLLPGGRLGMVCSDRWRFMAFAEEFRDYWLPEIEIQLDEPISAIDAYVRDVDAYPTLLVLRRRATKRVDRKPVSSQKTLREAGFKVKVGPALGCTPAFVLDAEAAQHLEPEILVPWLDGTEVKEGAIDYRGRKVIALYGDDGKLRDLSHYPLAGRHMAQFRPTLENRAVSRKGAEWYRPIDKVCATDWEQPKLLVPEIAKVPRIAFDTSGAIPSHGVYAIFGESDDLECLYRQLAKGGLAKALEGIAPKVKGGYVRCYKRFLEQIRV
ncbi:Eco57I restriction-modification methylase domain-containing protein [Pelagibacterium halotolerans]|uniref:Eco57I restriction-modification methylase domain-containing protein n=1 Tax=Pelagibacterium halotolerans TaxID=531813 RepID=UPI00384D0E4D